ncbi:MAG: glycosyltransferase family 39 protein, partial [Myxococcales bacterium]|nr:glycosyltransferase family 39 protein [Myxococcales bacterium]
MNVSNAGPLSGARRAVARLAGITATLPAAVGWRDHVIGGALALAYVAWLLATAASLGFPRDEGLYFHAGTQYANWWRLLFDRGREALDPNAIDAAWSLNHEHPALMKSLFGLSEWLFHEKWHVFADASTAYRLPGMACAGMAIWTIYLFGARAWGRRAGLVAAVLFALMPRVFFHAHLACFDVPITAFWILCVYVHWRAQERRGLAWAVALGVVYGLTLETKHNAWVLPAALLPHAFFVHRHGLVRSLLAGRVSIPASVVAMVTIGPLVFYGLWPYLWRDPLGRVSWYVDFHVHHEYYNIEFLGKNYFGPPSPKSYLPVMVLATVPTVTLVLFAVGAADRLAAGARRAWRWARRRLGAPLDRLDHDPRETELLLALSILVAVGPFFLPATPIFGGTKHWMPAYPGLALFGGLGFHRVRSAMRRAWPAAAAGRARQAAAEALLALSVTIAPLAETIHSFPFGLSSYVPIVGGTAGGADLGLNRQFWGFTTESLAPWLEKNARPNETFFFMDTAWPS